MPIYDYQCEICETTFEVERPMGFSGKVKCQACGSMRTTKVFGAAGVHFKGSGFYVTDSSKKANPTATSVNGTNGDNKVEEKKPVEKAAKPDKKDK